MREWYLSAELVGLEGMANSVTGVSQKAKRNNWLRRHSAKSNNAFEFHISNFHPDVKKQIIEKYVTDPEEAKLLMALEAPTEEVVPEPSNVSKIVPLSEVKDWCELPVFDVHAAAGAGSLVFSEYQIETLIVPNSLLAEFGLAQNSAAIIYVDGNSMEPTLSHKDRLLVDTRELQHPVTDGVYVIRIDDAVYVKRLKWNIPKGIYQVISDNPTYESFEINHKNGRNFKIIGKAIAPVFKKIF
ncbi:S24 family peptidase [Vibrio fluvialis]|uniref:S24 family peptidase n=1 Tax=Vibrio fluvialis TaxID=676 RepID=UPI001C9C6DDB|nr:S24 family peptidase [Vibrio fluvialis]EKO3996778.1 peptidase [Vibrio fluvialis]MBY7982033.1 S24 family peptidase [Vibrio fluvialis]MBY8251554.1 S24 family peptidase [Vibrio fluvialis]MBY8314934.1 S24 family peptidase [Vibrio fluvialis]MCG6357686.1 S24 family peptidase [Vibrio fluvialis]